MAFIVLVYLGHRIVRPDGFVPCTFSARIVKDFMDTGTVLGLMEETYSPMIVIV